MPTIRPMTLDDTRAALELAGATFADLSRRMNEEPEPPPPDLEAAERRYRTFVTHDPEGAWVAEDEHGDLGAVAADRPARPAVRWRRLGPAAPCPRLRA
jgi:hypothetical protein